LGEREERVGTEKRGRGEGRSIVRKGNEEKGQETREEGRRIGWGKKKEKGGGGGNGEGRSMEEKGKGQGGRAASNIGRKGRG
jgi:hypothetical protein